MECDSAIKKKKILPFVTTRMDLEAIMLSEVTQRKTSTAQSHLHVESKKNWAHWYREQIGCQKFELGMGKMGEGGQNFQL